MVCCALLCPFSTRRLWVCYVFQNYTEIIYNTVLGRVMSRLSKDQDVLDTQLSMTLFQVRHLSYNTRTDLTLPLALVYLWKCYRHSRLGVLHFPLPRYHLRPAECPLLHRGKVLPRQQRRDKTTRLFDAFRLIRVLLRDTHRTFNRTSVSKPTKVHRQCGART